MTEDTQILLVCVYAALSCITFALYAIDKRAAKEGSRRTRVGILHGWALAGGFVGAWAGMWLLRHKNRKPGFVVISLLAALMHGAGWYFRLKG